MNCNVKQATLFFCHRYLRLNIRESPFSVPHNIVSVNKLWFIVSLNQSHTCGLLCFASHPPGLWATHVWKPFLSNHATWMRETVWWSAHFLSVTTAGVFPRRLWTVARLIINKTFRNESWGHELLYLMQLFKTFQNLTLYLWSRIVVIFNLIILYECQ